MRAVCQSPFFMGDPAPLTLGRTVRCPYWARFGLWLATEEPLTPTTPDAVMCGVHRGVLLRRWLDTLDIRPLAA